MSSSFGTEEQDSWERGRGVHGHACQHLEHRAVGHQGWWVGRGKVSVRQLLLWWYQQKWRSPELFQQLEISFHWQIIADRLPRWRCPPYRVTRQRFQSHYQPQFLHHLLQKRRIDHNEPSDTEQQTHEVCIANPPIGTCHTHWIHPDCMYQPIALSCAKYLRTSICELFFHYTMYGTGSESN